uniref:Insulin-degrading-like metalloprotease family n=1 Tax=Tetraselmis sp. GSL018 TaxID=582737 RepID=A0A061RBI7_9CHLO
MVHTQFHFTCHSEQLRGALDRLAQFFISPRLAADAIAREVQAVDAEYSRNTNSDSRRLLQLKRSAGGAPYSSFSTGNIETLWEGPASKGIDVAAAVRALWTKCYTADRLTVVVVGPQEPNELLQMAEESFAVHRGGAANYGAKHPTPLLAPPSALVTGFRARSAAISGSCTRWRPCGTSAASISRGSSPGARTGTGQASPSNGSPTCSAPRLRGAPPMSSSAGDGSRS